LPDLHGRLPITNWINRWDSLRTHILSSGFGFGIGVACAEQSLRCHPDWLAPNCFGPSKSGWAVTHPCGNGHCGKPAKNYSNGFGNSGLELLSPRSCLVEGTKQYHASKLGRSPVSSHSSPVCPASPCVLPGKCEISSYTTQDASDNKKGVAGSNTLGKTNAISRVFKFCRSDRIFCEQTWDTRTIPYQVNKYFCGAKR
jgi:hypothetical protein